LSINIPKAKSNPEKRSSICHPVYPGHQDEPGKWNLKKYRKPDAYGAWMMKQPFGADYPKLRL